MMYAVIQGILNEETHSVDFNNDGNVIRVNGEINNGNDIIPINGEMDSDSDTLQVTAEIGELQVVDFKAQAVFPMVLVPDVGDSINLCVPDTQRKYVEEEIFAETDILTAAKNTTNTVEGYLTNVLFLEADLIHKVVPNRDVVLAECNFGRVIYPGYTDPKTIPKKKTNRGRKKKEKVKKDRKVQGTGECFSSQITFRVVSRNAEIPESGNIPDDTDVYKFKVFRNGKIQLPGAIADEIVNVVDCAYVLAKFVNNLLHTEDTPLEKRTMLSSIKAVMKDYKLSVKLPNGYLLDLDELDKCIQLEKSDIKVFDTKVTPQGTRYAVRFCTPTPQDPHKMLRVSIFMKGKINILGALNDEVTTQVCQFLNDVLEKHWDAIVVEDGDVIRPYKSKNNNIAEVSDEICESFINWIPKLPTISDELYEYVLKSAEEYRIQEMEKINDILAELGFV